MKVVLASRAVTDLSRIGRFIARDNPLRAQSLVAELRETARGLAVMPLAFPLVPRYEPAGIRRRAWRGYAILYSVHPDRVFIHCILGPGQNIDRILGLI